MADQNLRAALEASLKMSDPDNPLGEVSPDSVDTLLDRINTHIAEGMPEKVTDDDLRNLTLVLRAKAYEWAQQEQKPKTPRGSGTKRKPAGDIVDIEL